jgi:hypothetical protein
MVTDNNIEYGKIIIHPDFYNTTKAIEKNKFSMLLTSNPTDFDFDPFTYPSGTNLLTKIEDTDLKILNIQNGQKMVSKFTTIVGYDESMYIFQGLEGSSCLTTHCLALHGMDEFKPVVLGTYYFYTRSQKYSKVDMVLRCTPKIEEEMKKDYTNDRLNFLLEYVPNDSLVFIDGPLIGGNLSYATRDLNNRLLDKGAIPVFFVKNSNSNLVTDNDDNLKNKYNSDMDWAHKNFKMGERSPFFKYVDQKNKENGKIFAYFRTSDLTVQRIEFDINTFEKYRSIINDVVDLSFYLLNVNGNDKNPQIRTIAIAEKYAREVLKYLKNSELRMFNFTPTMNGIRFNR